MDFGITLLSMQTNKDITEKKLQAYNAHTAELGLSLTIENVRELAQRQHETLNELQRVEFGAGPLENIIKVFGDSPYIDQDSYSETLGALQDAFYQLKDSTENSIPDDDLIDAMRVLFDDSAHGSPEFFDDLSSEVLDKALKRINTDKDEDWSEYDTINKETAVENAPEPLADNLSKVSEAERFDRATNEYAAGFYDEQFELYRTAFDFNSRIGGSSL